MSKVSSILPELIEQLFNELSTRPKGKFEDRDYLELKSLFNEVFDKSLHLLSSRGITLYQSENNLESILEITGTDGKVRKLFPDVNFCSCDDFKINVIQNQNQYTCEHVLALKLADLLGKFEVQTLEDDHFNFVMQQLAP